MSEGKIEKFEQKSPETQAAADELSQEDEVGENLFDREAMLVVDANVAAPVNAAVAAKRAR